MKEINNDESYPNIRESWGILGTIILLMILFYPTKMIFNTILGTELTSLIVYVLAIGTAFSIFHFKRKNLLGTSSYDFGIGSIKLVLLVCVATAAILIGIDYPIISQIPMPDFLRKILFDQGLQTGVYSFIAIVIAAPVLEELIFRGIILNGLLKSYSPLKSILISSLLFGLVHLNPWQFIGASILGAFSGWVYFKTNKLSLSIIIHLTNNLLAFLSIYFDPKSKNIDSTLKECSLPELYGGTKSLIIILTVAIIVAISSIFLLYREFNKNTIKRLDNADSGM